MLLQAYLCLKKEETVADDKSHTNKILNENKKYIYS